MNASGLVIAAGTVAFVGNAKAATEHTVPWLRIVAATAALTVLVSTVENGPLKTPVTWLAGIMLLTALIRYVPNFSNGKS